MRLLMSMTVLCLGSCLYSWGGDSPELEEVFFQAIQSMEEPQFQFSMEAVPIDNSGNDSGKFEIQVFYQDEENIYASGFLMIREGDRFESAALQLVCHDQIFWFEAREKNKPVEVLKINMRAENAMEYLMFVDFLNIPKLLEDMKAWRWQESRLEGDTRVLNGVMSDTYLPGYFPEEMLPTQMANPLELSYNVKKGLPITLNFKLLSESRIKFLIRDMAPLDPELMKESLRYAPPEGATIKNQDGEKIR